MFNIQPKKKFRFEVFLSSKKRIEELRFIFYTRSKKIFAACTFERKLIEKKVVGQMKLYPNIKQFITMDYSKYTQMEEIA